MSSFMCSPETISVITDLMIPAASSLQYGHIFRRKHHVDGLTDIFNTLAEMNEKALKERYPDDCKEMLWNPKEYNGYRPVDTDNIYRVLKCFDCYLYQCAEGEIPNTDLYKLVRRTRNDLAINFIRSNPAYEEAPWE